MCYFVLTHICEPDMVYDISISHLHLVDVFLVNFWVNIRYMDTMVLLVIGKIMFA